jgi:hypothetical protein
LVLSLHGGYSRLRGDFSFPEFLGAKSTSIRDCVGPSVRPSVPHDVRLRGKIVTSRLRFEKRKRYVAIEIREEEKEEETDYVAIPLRRDSFAPRD